jgi:SAM-dependent methyltransferase
VGDGEVAPSQPATDPHRIRGGSIAGSGRGGHWFEAIAEHTGAAYLRYSFTKGTGQEVDFIVEALGLEPGMRVLDVGCGPGRHSNELAQRGIEAHGVDISGRFIELARAEATASVANGVTASVANGVTASVANGVAATFERLDARALPFDGEFDAAISLCQGGFGLLRGEDDVVLAGMARAVRPGGRVACSAFSAYFQVRYLDDSTFDADAGVNHERTIVKDESGRDAVFDLWTTCFTPRELRLLARTAGLVPEHVWSVGPGAYARNPPTIDSYEFLLVARRPG